MIYIVMAALLLPLLLMLVITNSTVKGIVSN